MDKIAEIKKITNLNGLLDNIDCLELNINITKIRKKIKQLIEELKPEKNIKKLSIGLNDKHLELYEEQLNINKREIEYQIVKLNNSIEENQALLSEEQNKLIKNEDNKEIIENNILELENIINFYKKEMDNLLKIKEKTNRQLEHLNITIVDIENNTNKKIIEIEDSDKINNIKNRLTNYLNYIYPISFKEQYLFFELKDIKNDINLEFEADEVNIEELESFYEKVKIEKKKIENKLKNKANYIKNSIDFNLKNMLENNLLSYSIQIKKLENDIKYNEIFINLYQDNITEYKLFYEKINNKNKEYENSNDDDVIKEMKKNKKIEKELLEKIEKLNKLIISLENTILNIKKNKKSLEFIIAHEKKELTENFSNNSMIDNDNLLNDKIKLDDIKIIEIMLKIHIEYNKNIKLIKEILNQENKLIIKSWIRAKNKTIENTKSNEFMLNLLKHIGEQHE